MRATLLLVGCLAAAIVTTVAQSGAARTRSRRGARERHLQTLAQRDGTFTVTNPRNGFSKTYRKGSVK